jgi:hypothetical protein
MISPRSSRSFILLGGILVLSLACSSIEELTSGNKTTSRETPNSLSASGEDTLTQIDLWLQATVSLRSVNLELVTASSTRDLKTLSAQIDSKGNMHLSLSLPFREEIAATPDAPSPIDFELFLVDGAAYTRTGGEGPAAPNNSYLTMLLDTLLGPEGPGLWLNILPEKDFTSAGNETHGGFNAVKYNVDGQLEKGAVQGMIWIDGQSDALVDAELTVSEGLFFPPGSDQGGDVKITLTVEKTEVPTVTLP